MRTSLMSTNSSSRRRDLSPPDVDPRRSALMKKVKEKTTGPELAVRRLIHGLGYRFRLHRRDLPGTPDLE